MVSKEWLSADLHTKEAQGNPKRGHLVTLQLQHKVEIREFVVLTSECKVSYHKEPLTFN